MNIQELPEEVLLTFLEYLKYDDLMELEMVSKFFNKLIFDNKIYKRKYLQLPEYDHKQYFDEWLEKCEYFHVRKMVEGFYKKRLHQIQFLNGRKIRGIYSTGCPKGLFIKNKDYLTLNSYKLSHSLRSSSHNKFFKLFL